MTNKEFRQLMRVAGGLVLATPMLVGCGEADEPTQIAECAPCAADCAPAPDSEPAPESEAAQCTPSRDDLVSEPAGDESPDNGADRPAKS